MKVLIYSKRSWPSTGGVETATHALAAGLVRRGILTTLVTDTLASEERPASYKIVRCPSFRQWSELIGEHDLLHIQVPRPTSLFLAGIAKFRAIPITLCHHNAKLIEIDPCLFRNGEAVHKSALSAALHHIQLYGLISLLVTGFAIALKRLLTNCVSANVVVSRYLAIRQPVPKQTIILNPVDLQLLQAANLTEASEAVKMSRFAFTFLGRLASGKGVDDLLRAFAKLCTDSEMREHLPELKLKIIGDGPKKAALLQLCRDLQIDPRVEWVGSKTGENLALEIKQSGIFVVPSSYEEPLGVVVLELMSAGKALIVPYYGGATEYAGDGCLTFINQDVESLTAAMKKLYLDRDLQLSFSAMAIERAKLFDSEALVNEYISLFEKLI